MLKELRKYAGLVIPLALAVQACAGPRPIDRSISALDQPKHIPTLSPQGETVTNRAKIFELLQDYCTFTGCDPESLLPKITFLPYPEPTGQFHMTTIRDQMTIYSTVAGLDNAGPFFHEFAHLDTKVLELNPDLIAKMGFSDTVRVQGFSLVAEELPEDQRGLIALEEAAADAIMLLKGQQEGVRYESGYGNNNSGLFLLRLAEKRGFLDEFISLHQNSALFEFIQKITGLSEDLIGYQALYTTVEDLQSLKLTSVDEAEEYFEDLLQFLRSSS